MKRGIQIAFAIKENAVSRFSLLFLLLLLSMNLSGQKIKTVLSEKWTTVWEKDSRQTFTYDINGHVINLLTESWNGLSFENQGQINSTINPDGTTHQMVTQLWVSGLWTDLLTITYTYNSSKKVLTTVLENSLLSSSSKQTNSYDGSGYLTNTLSQDWNGLSWDDKTKSAFTNDGNGNATEVITQLWNGVQWNNSTRTTSTYDGNGNETQLINQQWDGVSAWTNITRSTSTYNGSNEVLTTISDKWKSGNWEPDSKETNSYDGSGFLTNNLSQTWNGASWDDKNQTNNIKNPDGTVLQATDQSWDGVKWNNTERFSYTYDSATGYSELSSDKTDFTIYPNPASDFIRIKTNKSISGTDYYFADQSGKTVLKGKMNSESNSIDINSLANGVYFLHFGEGREFTFKVVKNQLK